MKQELDKCVLVIDEAMPRGLAAHTAAIQGITWGRLRPELVGEDVTDAAGAIHPGIIRTPVPVLSGRPETFQTLRRQLAELEISPAVAAHRDDIYLNEKLFGRVEAVYEKLDSLPLTPEQKRLTELTYKNFVRAGAGLTPRSKKRLREINSELTTLGTRFGNNLLAENKDFALVLDSLKQTTGLPDDVINAAAAEAEARGMKGKYVFTLG